MDAVIYFITKHILPLNRSLLSKFGMVRHSYWLVKPVRAFD